MICIIDYQAGNLHSVKRALDYIGVDSVVSSDPSVIKRSQKLIFPGVGAAGEAMRNLDKFKLTDAIKEAFYDGKMILGICLGAQIVLQSSEEDKENENNTPTLGLIEGVTKKFSLPPQFTIPHMGWNQANLEREHSFFSGVPTSTNFYFVHSYYTEVPKEMVLTSTEYGGRKFTSAISYKNLICTQFHLEKSGRYGLQLLKNFAKLDTLC